MVNPAAIAPLTSGMRRIVPPVACSQGSGASEQPLGGTASACVLVDCPAPPLAVPACIGAGQRWFACLLLRPFRPASSPSGHGEAAAHIDTDVTGGVNEV